VEFLFGDIIVLRQGRRDNVAISLMLDASCVASMLINAAFSGSQWKPSALPEVTHFLLPEQ